MTEEQEEHEALAAVAAEKMCDKNRAEKREAGPLIAVNIGLYDHGAAPELGGSV